MFLWRTLRGSGSGTGKGRSQARNRAGSDHGCLKENCSILHGSSADSRHTSTPRISSRKVTKLLYVTPVGHWSRAVWRGAMLNSQARGLQWTPPKISKRKDPGVRTLFAKGVFENYEWKVDFTLSFMLFQTIMLFNRKIHLYYKYKLPCLKSASPGKQVSCFPRWKRRLLNNLEEPSFQQVGTVHTTSSDAQFPSPALVVQT